MSYYKFVVDSEVFYLTGKTLDETPDCLLTRIVREDYRDECVVKVSYNEYVVDRDPDSFRVIVSYLRGYPLNINFDPDVREKVLLDIEYFNITGLNFKEQVIKMDGLFEEEDLDLDKDDVNKISTSEKVIEEIKNYNRLRDEDDSDISDGSVKEYLNASDSE